MTNEQPLIPPVIWAQRDNVVFVTICVEDCKNPEIKIESEQIVFRSVAGLEQKVYAITIPLFAPVDVVTSRINRAGRCIELVLEKLKDDNSYWPHLTKEKKKYHWLKIDFKKWKDEDDSEDESEVNAANSGGLGGGLGGGMGGDANIDDMLSMMGGGGPGGAQSQFGNIGGDTDDSDDEEEMPGLDDIESENAGKGKEKSEGDLVDLKKVKQEPIA